MSNWAPEAKCRELIKKGKLKDESAQRIQPKVQDNKQAEISKSQIQNKADIQAEAKIKAILNIAYLMNICI